MEGEGWWKVVEGGKPTVTHTRDTEGTLHQKTLNPKQCPVHCTKLHIVHCTNVWIQRTCRNFHIKQGAVLVKVQIKILPSNENFQGFINEFILTKP